jgi:hypothetical protein
MPRTTQRRLGAFLLAVGLLAAGCGSSVADLGGDGGSAAAAIGSDGSEPNRPEESMLAFAQCMREHGVDMPDPQFKEGGRGFMAVEIDPEDGDFREAEKACKHLMAGAVAEARDVDPERMKEMEQRMLAFAECMRGQGIDFPDPQIERGGGGGFLFGGPGQDLPVDPEGREFQEAEEACRGELPGFPGHEPGARAGGEQ